MVGTIGYLGKVQFKLAVVCALLYTMGAALSSSAFGALLGLVGLLIRSGTAAIGASPDLAVTLGVAFFLVLCAVYEFANPRLRFPQRRRQLERSHWVTRGRRGAAFWWGLVMGLGFWTPIVFPLYYGILALAIASGSPLGGALIMGAYGATQGLWLTAVTLAVSRGGDRVPGLIRSAGSKRWSHRINGAAALGLSAYLIGALVLSARGF